MSKVKLFDVRMHFAIDPITDRAHISAELVDKWRTNKVVAKSPDCRSYEEMMEWLSGQVTAFLEPIEKMLPDSVAEGYIGVA